MDKRKSDIDRKIAYRLCKELYDKLYAVYNNISKPNYEHHASNIDSLPCDIYKMLSSRREPPCGFWGFVLPIGSFDATIFHLHPKGAYSYRPGDVKNTFKINFADPNAIDEIVDNYRGWVKKSLPK